MKKSVKSESPAKTIESFLSSNLVLIGLFMIILFLIVFLMFDKMMVMDERLNTVENGSVQKMNGN